MAKPVIKFKTYRQATAVGGKIYGVPNLGDPVVASVTMQEVIDYAKLHNYSADTLEALLSQVIAGVGDLVARDGRPRMLSDLLKFEPVIKGTFDNLEQTVTNQKVLVRPRMLKEIKVKLNASDYSWQNQNDIEAPRLVSIAPTDERFTEVNLASVLASLTDGGKGWSFAGTRLCPNGYDANCAFEIIWDHRIQGESGFQEVHLEKYLDGEINSGFQVHAEGDEASDNVLVTSHFNYGLDHFIGWYLNAAGQPVEWDSAVRPVAGERIRFVFRRTLSNGETYTAEKAYTL